MPATMSPETRDHVARHRPPAEHISRAAFASFVGASGASRTRDPVALAAELWRGDQTTATVIRAAASPALAGDHAGVLSSETAAFLMRMPASAGAALMAASLVLPLAGRSELRIPIDQTAPDAGAPWIGEADEIPVHQGITGSLTLGPLKKLAVILTASRQLARQPGAEMLFNAMLQARAARALDAAIFATTAASDAAVAGLLHNVAELDGGAPASLPDALARLSGALGDAGGSGAAIICAHPTTAGRVELAAPLLRWPLVATAAIPVGRLIALDPAGLVFGTGAGIDLETTNTALINMNSDPAAIVASGTTADPARDLFQTDAIAMRLILEVAFAARPGSVQFVEAGHL